MGDQFTLQAPTEREEGAWVPIPDNTVLRAMVLTAAKVKMPFQDKVTGEDVFKVKWTFQIVEDGTFNGRKVEGQTSTAFVAHDDCRLYQWVKALFNQDIPQDFTLDTDELQHLECVVTMKSEEKERSDGKGIWVKNTVIDVRPAENAPVVAGSAYGNVDYNEEPF